MILFPRRLVEAGIVWRFRERKGLEFMTKWTEYQELMAQYSNTTKMRTKIDFGPVKMHRWQDMIPAFIPES